MGERWEENCPRKKIKLSNQFFIFFLSPSPSLLLFLSFSSSTSSLKVPLFQLRSDKQVFFLLIQVPSPPRWISPFNYFQMTILFRQLNYYSVSFTFWFQLKCMLVLYCIMSLGYFITGAPNWPEFVLLLTIYPVFILEAAIFNWPEPIFSLVRCIYTSSPLHGLLWSKER